MEKDIPNYKRCSPVTEEQKKLIIEFIRKHEILQRGKLSNGVSYKDIGKLWSDLAEILNCVPGLCKEWKEWRKTWHDMRTRTKAKNSKNNIIIGGTGGGIPTSEILTPIEMDVADFISPLSTSGLDIPESQVGDITIPPLGNSIPCETGVSSDRKNNEINNTPCKTKNKVSSPLFGSSRKKSASKRLETGISVAQDMSATMQERLSYQQDYYEKKLKLLERQIAAQEHFYDRLVTAGERIAAAAESQATAFEHLGNVLLEFQ